jgi:hypothetical protein
LLPQVVSFKYLEEFFYAGLKMGNSGWIDWKD